MCRHCRSITSTHLRQVFAHITMLQRQSCNKLNNVWYRHVHIYHTVVVPAGLEHQTENQQLLMSFLVMGGVNGMIESRHFRFLLSRTQIQSNLFPPYTLCKHVFAELDVCRTSALPSPHMPSISPVFFSSLKPPGLLTHDALCWHPVICRLCAATSKVAD